MLPPDLTEPASAIARLLQERNETVAVAESAAGGLISAALLTVPGASAFYRGGLVIYTPDGAREQLAGIAFPRGVRGASEEFARFLAAAAADKLSADWGIGETGASGPAGNPYGDAPGHSWVAVRGPGDEVRAQHVLTGSDDRGRNMDAFAVAGLRLLLAALG